MRLPAIAVFFLALNFGCQSEETHFNKRTVNLALTGEEDDLRRARTKDDVEKVLSENKMEAEQVKKVFANGFQPTLGIKNIDAIQVLLEKGAQIETRGFFDGFLKSRVFKPEVKPATPFPFEQVRERTMLRMQTDLMALGQNEYALGRMYSDIFPDDLKQYRPERLAVRRR